MLPPLMYFLVVQKSNATAPLSSRWLDTYISDKRGGDSERITGYRQRQCRQTPRRRPEYDLRALTRVVFGIVAHAFEDVPVAAILLDPGGDGTAGVRTDGRIGDDTVG